MKSKTILWTSCISLIAILIQSTLLVRLAIHNVIPDLVLCILVFVAYVNGTMIGQINGFVSGVILDFISLSPLGYNMLIRTIIGAIVGIIKDTFFLDIFLLPMILCALATLLKAALVLILHLLFDGLPFYSFTTSTLWLEVLLNALVAPLVFAFLKLFKKVLMPAKDV